MNKVLCPRVLLLCTGVGMLGKFISVREPNIKYLGLENMVRLAEVPAVSEAINRRAPAHWHPCACAALYQQEAKLSLPS